MSGPFLTKDGPCRALDSLSTARVAESTDELTRIPSIAIFTHLIRLAVGARRETAFAISADSWGSAGPERCLPAPIASGRTATSSAELDRNPKMKEQHIASAFDRDLEALQGMLMKMGGLVESAILDSAKLLEVRDIELSRKVREGDAAIDDLEEQINDEATRIIALRAPTASDLRTVLTVIRISANLERCGDYAKNLAKRTQVLAESPRVADVDASIKRIAREVQFMLKDALDAFIQRDSDLAERIILRDEDVDQLYNSIFRELLTYMMEDPRNITPCMHLHFVAKNMERMGDHVTNIAEQVVYMATGKFPDDSRPKKDRTPYINEGI